MFESDDALGLVILAVLYPRPEVESTEIADDAEGALDDVLDLIYRDAIVLDAVLEGADGERKQREDYIVEACVHDEGVPVLLSDEREPHRHAQRIV